MTLKVISTWMSHWP